MKKGGLTDPGAAVFLMGVASASGGRWDEARESFEDAQEFEGREMAAKEWLVHIDGEEAAEEEQAAIEAAKQEELKALAESGAEAAGAELVPAVDQGGAPVEEGQAQPS